MKSRLAVLIHFLLYGVHITGQPATIKRDANFESVRTRLDRPYQNLKKDHPNKYFHESTFNQHYDGRFADRPLKYDEKQAHLSALIQTYLSTMDSIGAETWIMHGTLLGWYWNHKIMPWDSDLDVMISERSLELLAGWHNMTMHRFRFPGQKQKQEQTRAYLLEVNPHCNDLEPDEDNHIDARWIDTETGLFIDVTTLHPEGTAHDVDAMMVKDKHRYTYDDIYPLRESVFEGATVLVPFAYTDILVEEYGDHALSDVEHEHHRYDEKTQTWVPQRVLSGNVGKDGKMKGPGNGRHHG